MPRNDTTPHNGSSGADHPDTDRLGVLSRRRMLAATAGASVVGVTGAALLPTAALATEPAGATPAEQPAQQPQHGGPVVAHVHDAATGQVVLFQGTRRVEVHDPQLAALLVRAAAAHS